MSNENCIFCKIVANAAPCHKVWEDDNHLAFLTIFPNTDGATVVIPKKHAGSYVFEQDDKIITNLLLAAKKVAKKIDNAFADVARTALVFEGYGVDHLHIKLFPMHGTKNPGEWKPINSDVKKFFTQYEGYISSHDYKREDDAKLAAIAKKIREQ